MIFRKKPRVLRDPRREAYYQLHDRIFPTMPRLQDKKGWQSILRRYMK